MRPGLSKLLASPALLRCLGSATAGSIGSSGVRASGGPETSPEDRCRLELGGKKRDVLALVGDENFEFNEKNMRTHIEALREGFFGVLAESKFSPSLDKETKARILGMSPKSFERKCREWFDRSTEVRRHESRLAHGEKDAAPAAPQHLPPVPHQELEALRASLKKRGCCTVELPSFEDYCAKVAPLLCKVLGEGSVSALYESYLDCERRLRRMEGRDAVDNGPEEHEDCVLCSDPLGPGEEKTHCVNGHEFHERCLYRQSREGSGRCAICRGAFAEAQLDGLAAYGTRYMDHLRTLYGDPAFEKRYVCAGRQMGMAQKHLLEDACEAVRDRISSLKRHPAYAAVFNSPESSVCRRFYIPQNIASYFENTEVGHRDPRSRGFTRHKAVLIKHVLSYAEQLNIDPYLETGQGSVLLDGDIVLPIHSMLNILFTVDALLEYLCTRLCEIKDPAEKMSAIAGSPGAYPALHSLVSRHPGHTLDQIYRKLRLIANGFDLSVPVYTQQWLLTACGLFSEIVAEV